jgi:hypothetical protein
VTFSGAGLPGQACVGKGGENFSIRTFAAWRARQADRACLGLICDARRLG